MAKARQGMTVSITELRNLINELQEEVNDLDKFGKRTVEEKENQKFLIPIINKTPKCSDTWELER